MDVVDQQIFLSPYQIEIVFDLPSGMVYRHLYEHGVAMIARGQAKKENGRWLILFRAVQDIWGSGANLKDS